MAAARLINGQAVGRSWSSVHTPLVVPMRDWRGHDVALVELSRPGYAPVVARVRLVAGTRAMHVAHLARDPAYVAAPAGAGPTRARARVSIDELTDLGLGH